MSLPRTTDYPCRSSSPRKTDSVEFHWDQSDSVFLKATEDGQHASIVLDRAQALSLRDQLTSWLGDGCVQEVSATDAALSASAEPSAPVERAHEIPGTSFQRLNALANQGE